MDAANDVEVLSINPDGSGETRLDSSPRVDFGPRWSPDGSQIAFVSHRDDIDSVDVYVMNADGSGVRRLIIGAESPAWSPDGAQISFTRSVAGNTDIYAVRVDGTDAPRQITRGAGEDVQPTWSPDGSTIAFTLLSAPVEEGGRDEIMAIDANGVGPSRNLTKNATAFDASPSWSPDGSRIAFMSDRSRDPEVYVMRSDGTRRSI